MTYTLERDDQEISEKGQLSHHDDVHCDDDIDIT